MARLRYGTLLSTILLISAVSAYAQPPSAGKNGKSDAKKNPAKDMKAPENKPAAPVGKPSDPPDRPTLEKMKLPTDAIVILVEKLQEAAELIPKAIYLSPEKYQELQERIRALEKRLKPDRANVHSCKLTGKLDGEYLALRAEFTFATLQPKSTVILGLQGAHLSEGGDLDNAAAQIDYGDDGFVVLVEREGAHRLTLHLKTPIVLKRGAGPVASGERGFEIGLPGAPATTLNLEMPAAIKELRVNDAPRTSKGAGRWDLPLGLAKQLSVTWKEPQSQGGGKPLLTMSAQITVELKETAAHVQAELLLEDAHGLTKEWRLLLPPGAKPTVTSLPASAYEWTYPSNQAPWHVFKTKDVSGERIAVTVSAEAARPAAKVAAGPFALLGAFRQQGTVLVQATPDALHGQRLVYHRQGDVTQRNLPKKGAPGVEPLAYFQFTTAPPDATLAKPPLELEFKASGGLAETQTDHVVKLKGEGTAWNLETTTRIQANSLAEVTDFLDVQLPRGRPSGLEALATMPMLAFPAAAPWPAMLPADGRIPWAVPLEFRWEEEGSSLSSSGTTPAARLKWSRQDGRQLSLTIHGKYAVPYGNRTARVELPRPLGSIERGATLTVSSGPLVELLMGTPGAAEPATERHRWLRQMESAPIAFDLTWRALKPTLAVTALADVTLLDRSAQIKQRLQFATPKNGPADAKIRLQLPPSIQRIAVVSGGSVLGAGQPEDGVIWVAPQFDPLGKCDLLLAYEIAGPIATDVKVPALARQPWAVPLIWPATTTDQEAKVRVWSLPGTVVKMDPDAGEWRQRSIETVPGREFLPTLVAYCAGTSEPLQLHVQTTGGTLPATLCDRTLIQVRLDEEGNQFYRARHWIRKLAARQLTLELPSAVREIAGDNLIAIRIGPDGHMKSLSWHDVAKNKATTGELPTFGATPIVLEVEYKIPAIHGEGSRFGQAMLHPPRWLGDVLPGAVRWQVDLPGDQVGLLLDGGLTLDVRWMLHGWLIAPAPSVTSADLDAWLTGREGGEGAPISMAFWRTEKSPLRLVYFTRQGWLLSCSGLVLALGLAWHLLLVARWLRWLLTLTLTACVVFAVLSWPAILPPILYGAEPGLVVLIGLLGLQWLLQEHYRRQVVVMPGFARLQPGSTLNRAEKLAQSREPSTVDAPPNQPASSKSSQK